MDVMYRHRDVRVLNQKEDRDLQHRLNTLDKQYRNTLKTLRQRRDTLILEQGRVVMVKVCEPKAIVNIAMKEIGRRHRSGESRHQHQHQSEGSAAEQMNRSASAPLRRRGHVHANVSLLQMKNIATIDSISEKEASRRRQEAREEADRERRRQRETLHKRVTEFIRGLRERSGVGILESSRERV